MDTGHSATSQTQNQDRDSNLDPGISKSNGTGASVSAVAGASSEEGNGEIRPLNSFNFSSISGNQVSNPSAQSEIPSTSVPSNGALSSGSSGIVAARAGERSNGGGQAGVNAGSCSTNSSSGPLPAGLAAAEASFDKEDPSKKSGLRELFAAGRRSASSSPTPETFLKNHHQSLSALQLYNPPDLATEILPPPPRLPYDNRYPPLSVKMDAEVGAVSGSNEPALGVGSGNNNSKKRNVPSQIDRRNAAPTPQGSLPLGIRIALGKEGQKGKGQLRGPNR